MINTSREYKKAIKSNREFCIADEVTFSDGTKIGFSMDNLMSYTINEATSETGKFQVGAAIIKEYSAVLDNYSGRYDRFDFENADIRAKIGLLLPGGTWEFLNKGTYRITQAKEIEQTINIKAYDSMLYFDRPYSESTLEYPATINQIVQDACICCGMTYDASTVECGETIIQNRPAEETLTFRDIISFIAQIMGCYARINHQDALEFGWYSFAASKTVDSGVFIGTESDYLQEYIADGGEFEDIPENISDSGLFADMWTYHHFYDLKSKSINTDDIVITGVKVVLKQDSAEETKMHGTEGYVIAIENNPMVDGDNIKWITQYVGSKLVGNCFRPMNITCQSDPCIEAGDSAFVTASWKKQSIPTIITNTTFSAGGVQKSECSAETPTEKTYTKYSAATKIITTADRNAKRKLSAYDIAVQHMNQLAANTMGFYHTSEIQEDGSVIAYRHDKPQIGDSRIIYKSGIDGFWVSQDGGNTWERGFDSNGNAALNILSVIGINFNWASGGELVLGGDSNGNGILIVKDASGNQIGKWSKDGFEATKGSISNEYGSLKTEINAGNVTSYYDNVAYGKITSLKGPSSGARYYSILGQENSDAVSIGYNEANKAVTINNGANPNGFTEDVISRGNLRVTAGIFLGSAENIDAHIVRSTWVNSSNTYHGCEINDGLYVKGRFYATDNKSRVVDTQEYGQRALYCYETATPYFGDIGTGQINESGICTIAIDSILSETLAKTEYMVFLQKEGSGDLWVSEKEDTHFSVKGTPGLHFSWEIKAIQKGFESNYIDELEFDLQTEAQTDYSDLLDVGPIYDDSELMELGDAYLDESEQEDAQ